MNKSKTYYKFDPAAAKNVIVGLKLQGAKTAYSLSIVKVDELGVFIDNIS